MCPKQLTLATDSNPTDGRRIARNLQAILQSLPEEVQGQVVSFSDSYEIDMVVPVGEAIAETITELDKPIATNARFDSAIAIIRSRPDSTSPTGERWDVRSVVWDWEFAEDEVRRLNDVNSDKGYRYFATGTKVERRSREIQHIVQPLGPSKWPGDPDGPLIYTFTSVIEFNPAIAKYEARIPAFPDMQTTASTADDCIEQIKSVLQQRIARYLSDGKTIPQDTADVRLVPAEVKISQSISSDVNAGR